MKGSPLQWQGWMLWVSTLALSLAAALFAALGSSASEWGPVGRSIDAGTGLGTTETPAPQAATPTGEAVLREDEQRSMFRGGLRQRFFPRAG